MTNIADGGSSHDLGVTCPDGPGAEDDQADIIEDLAAQRPGQNVDTAVSTIVDLPDGVPPPPPQPVALDVEGLVIV